MKKNIRQRYSPKQKSRNSNKKGKPPNQNKQKGSLLEKVVAAMYKTPGVKIERNVHHPTTSQDGRTREIDILLTANVAGLPVKYAFQCKNEKGVIDVIKIDSFVGALEDIGIPPQHGIFVTVNGFTDGAIKRAKKAGIRTLVFKGLSKDRLKSEISAAIQHSVFLIPRIDEISVTNNIEYKGGYEQAFLSMVFMDEKQKLAGFVLDLFFNKWRNGDIPALLGLHDIEFEFPQGWFQFYEGEQVDMQKITGKVTVMAVVISIDGNAENHFLLDAETQQFEKFNTSVNFNQIQPGQVVPLKVFFTEQELGDFINSSSDVRLTVKTKLPRLIARNMYYPLSETVAYKVFEQMKNYGSKFENVTQEEFDRELYEVSKNDLFAAGMFSLTGKEVPIITTDNDGETVDATLLYNKGELDKVIALKDQYLKNPFQEFGNLIAWAYLDKSRQIYDKARTKNDKQKKRLLDESLGKLKKAFEIEPNFLPALDHYSTLMFAENNYKEAVKVLDYVLTQNSEDYTVWTNKSLALVRLKDYDQALAAINKAKGLVESLEDEIENLPGVLIRRARIFHHLGKATDAWQDILLSWQMNSKSTVKSSNNSNSILDIIDAAPSVEGILLRIETLYSRAAIFEKDQKQDIARELVDEAAETLNGIIVVEQAENEPFIIGQINGGLIEDVLIRSSKRLSECGNKELAEEQIEIMKNWFRQTFKEELDFCHES